MMARLDEARRLDILRRYAILDTPPEPVFDRITLLATEHFRVPIATVSFLDENRLWFKAVRGLVVRETDREIAFCHHTIQQEGVMVVPDLRADSRFADNPLVAGPPHLRFYAGTPLTTHEGWRLGTVTVMDYVPHPHFGDADRRFLKALAEIAVEELEVRLAAGDVKVEIEQRRRAEGELRLLAERFRLSLARSPMSLATQDAELRYTWAANTPPPLLPDQIIGHTDWELWRPEQAGPVVAAKREAMETGKVIRRVVECDVGGQPMLFDCAFEPLYDANGKIIGLATAAMDVTRQEADRRAVAAALAEAERANRAKAKFLAAASHDLRQPMQSLLLLLGVLRQKLRGHGASGVANSAYGACEAMRGLLDSLLDISRLEAGMVSAKPVPVALSGLVDRLAAEFRPQAERKGLELKQALCSDVVVTDPALLERILRHLIENALRFTERGGVLLGCRRRGGFVSLEVVDSGIGFPREQAQAIFDPFVQLGNPERDRAKGLGLGLAIVRRLADLMGLQLAVRSNPGKGSRFTLLLPLAESADAEHGPHEGERPLAGGRLVVIDDEEMVREALSLTLTDWGLDVVAAESPEQAVAHLGGSRPDAILADYRLREGRTGVEAIEAIRRHFGAPIPSILITGDTSPDRLAEAQASGYALLHKPVAVEDLRRQMERMLPG